MKMRFRVPIQALLTVAVDGHGVTRVVGSQPGEAVVGSRTSMQVTRFEGRSVARLLANHVLPELVFSALCRDLADAEDVQVDPDDVPTWEQVFRPWRQRGDLDGALPLAGPTQAEAVRACVVDWTISGYEDAFDIAMEAGADLFAWGGPCSAAEQDDITTALTAAGWQTRVGPYLPDGWDESDGGEFPALWVQARHADAEQAARVQDRMLRLADGYRWPDHDHLRDGRPRELPDWRPIVRIPETGPAENGPVLT